ncbi:MAG: SGNH/GDSL hydrolase family protein, partial [Candidatus Binatia bacterium]
PGAMLTKEILCSIAYGTAYSGVIDVSHARAEVFPERVTPRPGATRRVLHIGDSMVFGANVSREQTFAAGLEKLEPDVQHINGGISGMAPDDYLVMLRSWVAREPVDLAVMYLFAGNDLVGLDAPHPCSNWQSILVYEAGHATLRFPSAPKSARGIGLSWLVINSPLPYLGRVMIVAHSAVAAFLGGLLDSWSAQAVSTNPQIPFEHLESILRSARDDLREKHIPFVVVVLPHAAAIGIPGGPSDTLSRRVFAIAQQLGLPELDATDTIRDALARGEHPVQPDGSHFNEEGHWLMARWLHERLAASTGAPVR